MKTKLWLILILLLGLFLRLWNINFGLPHSWYADEPEIGEPSIKYTYEIKNILINNDVYKLLPQSYVYGTFPVYFYTVTLMVFSKTLGMLGIGFAKMDLYVFMRIINALISFAIIPVLYLLLKRLDYKYQTFALLAGVFLMAFNWKLIVHAHYLNHDIIITLLILLANFFFYKYLTKPNTLNTALFALCFGLAVSTKITVLLTLPLYLVLFIRNKDIKSLLGSVLIIAGVFIITNPFSWLFISDFVGRILEMRTKEGGMVFDSVDYSPFKYLSALSWVLTLPIFLLSAFGIIKSFKDKTSLKRQFLLLMALQITFYLLFFSIQGRRVDRWMLPVIPNAILFSVIGLDLLSDFVIKRSLKATGIVIAVLVAGYYLYFPIILLTQFQRNTPKSASYIWAKENLPPTSTKFGITEEGLDPLNKLPFSTIWQFNVYESDGAQFIYPPDPALYDYIILSSRPMSWTQKSDILKKYPLYASKWEQFEEKVTNTNYFEQVKYYGLIEPNLIPLSRVYVYKNLYKI